LKFLFSFEVRFHLIFSSKICIFSGPSILIGNETEHLWDDGTATPHCKVCFNLTEYLEDVLLLTVTHNLASWSFLQTNPCFAHSVALYGLENVSWLDFPRLVGKRWFERPRPPLAQAAVRLANEGSTNKQKLFFFFFFFLFLRCDLRMFCTVLLFFFFC
jgi:hypothetical protein